MRRSVDPCYTSVLPLKSTKSQLSLEKKLMSRDQNLLQTKQTKFWKFSIFSKKLNFFQILKIPWKKQLQELFFFWKDDSISKWFKIISNHFLRFLKASLESWDFTLSNSETLNATILLYAKSSHLEAKRSQFSAWKRWILYFKNWNRRI